MASFSVVDPPHGLSYAAPLVDFGLIGNLPDAYRRGQEQQRQADVANAFKDQPLPLDPATGLPDYGKIMQVLASKGGIDAITRLAPSANDQALLGQARQISPLLAGGVGAAPSAAGGPSPAPAAPQSFPAPSATATAGYTPMGNAPNSVANIVQTALPADKAGPVIVNMAKSLGVEPEAPLTPQQEQDLTRRLGAYASRTGLTLTAQAGPAAAPSGDGMPTATSGQMADARRRLAAGMAPAGDRVAQGFEDAGIPSIPAASSRVAPLAAPAAASPASPAATRAAPSGPQAPAPAPAAAAPEGGGRLTPAVPLPIDPQTAKPFTDPQAAITALRTEAARLSANPFAKGQVAALNDWATRIENAQQPLKVGQYDTIVSPGGQTLYQGPMAKVLSQGGGGFNSATLDADAENYRQTGHLPPNMGRGIQGQAEAAAIRQRAVEHEIAAGGNPDEWAARWQRFATRAAGLRTFEQRAAGLTLAESEAKRLIPRVRDISDKISRTDYPTINSLILAAQKHTGGEDVIRLGIAIESLVPVYARILKPVGTIGAADMERAHDILDKAWSKGQIRAALDQMGIELDSAKDALKDAREDFGAGPAKRDEDKKTAPGGGSSGGAVVRWERGPDGKLRPAQ